MITIELTDQERIYLKDLVDLSLESLMDCLDENNKVKPNFDFIAQEDADEELELIHTLFNKLGCCGGCI